MSLLNAFDDKFVEAINSKTLGQDIEGVKTKRTAGYISTFLMFVICIFAMFMASTEIQISSFAIFFSMYIGCIDVNINLRLLLLAKNIKENQNKTNSANAETGVADL